MTRAAFLGTPAEAVPVLEALAEVAIITRVITRPDRPKGRSGKVSPPPVKIVAHRQGWEVAQPERTADLAALVAGCDVAVVAAYGRIVPEMALRVPSAGFVNVHFSLLPRWRGASPVVRAILAGDAMTGVTLMQLDAGLDTGPILDRVETPIGPEESAGELTTRLAHLGAGLLRDRLEAVVSGVLRPLAQDETAATAAGKVTVAEAHLDPKRHHTTAMLRAVRAFNPKPGAWGRVEGLRLKVWVARPAVGEVPAGTAVTMGKAVVLGTADGAIELVMVQPEGRSPLAAIDWMNGRRGAAAEFD
ncbi:MAG TPA: methionyl-tRNA formyltransferase [Actinobacteria bacterium]|nr:methionyl-tRNA formyltransferase [Actinomycetota bacterium]